jgi:putative heme iron utilization protein
MDDQSARTLVTMLRGQRVASLGTLRSGVSDQGPLVSLIPFVAAPDFSAFYIHASRLAQHTQDILADPRVSLMVAETDDGVRDPQQLARVSLRGLALPVAENDPDYPAVRSLYLARFPQSAMTFNLGDFALYRIEPSGARYVAGFGKTFNLTADSLKRAALG